ncbi:GNAT family N-acetyltransferase [Paraglaciecola aquimarina]|uniref:GNAT family N-acetyltransferase n=1 Tax=Paraglaciecola algarum TaxID=3050085 RepID=A0ABS9D7Z1_9ALTE|nr:GNAT family N-acetyltransferase [Paraglaciecola sp. G1-23]MCF2949066.1 GNAT family N-acetyltransferase [Paraglaciecola sp. G1-23]
MINDLVQALTSQRLLLRPIKISDANFVLQLFNDPDCIEYIGDKGLHNQIDAIDYIKNGPLKMYQELDLGLLVVESNSGEILGLCGLLKREELSSPDLGFAFLPMYRNKGYAFESAQLVLRDAFAKKNGLQNVLAITTFTNDKSISLLGKLGFSYKNTLQLKGYNELSHLFELSAQ